MILDYGKVRTVSDYYDPLQLPIQFALFQQCERLVRGYITPESLETGQGQSNCSICLIMLNFLGLTLFSCELGL